MKLILTLNHMEYFNHLQQVCTSAIVIELTEEQKEIIRKHHKEKKYIMQAFISHEEQ